MRLPAPLKSALSHIDGEAWLRFLMAVLGLALAFVAALLSTIASEAGNVTATALLASTALLLAGVVGLITLPYLAKRVVATRLRDALDFEITREGMAYLGVALIIGVAALNTTNNLLFIVLAAMLAAIVVSGFASAAVLRGLELDVSVPEIAFAGKPIVAQVKLHNPRKVIPAFSVRVAAKLQTKKKKKPGWEWQRTDFFFPRKKKWIRVPDYALRRKSLQPEPPAIFERPVYFTFVAPHTTADAEVDLTFTQRGRYSQECFFLATRFPFSFLVKSRRVKLARELLVYPALLESEEFMDLVPTITGEHATLVRGSGTELYRIREHTPQDPARFVDWKASAKTASLKVREFSREDEVRLRIVFDNSLPEAASAEAYEHAVSLAASLAWHLHGRGISLSYAAQQYSGAPYLYDFLLYLALVQPQAGESILESLPPSDDYNLIITSRKPESVPASLRENSHVIFMEE